MRPSMAFVYVHEGRSFFVSFELCGAPLRLDATDPVLGPADFSETLLS